MNANINIAYFESKGGGGNPSASTSVMIKTTHSELVQKRDSNKLIPGRMYRITDYECTSSLEYTQCAGHNFDIIVTAISENKLSEVASALVNDYDTSLYFSSCNLSAWKIWYCLDNDTTRFMWALNGGHKVSVSMYENIMIFDVISINDDTYEDLPIKLSLELDGYNVVAYAPALSGTDLECYVDVTGSSFWCNCDLEDLGRMESGKGVVYRLIDEHNNDLPYDFKNMMFKRYKVYPESSHAYFRNKYVATDYNLFMLNDFEEAHFMNLDYIWLYTFASSYDNNNIDLSALTSVVYNNTFGQGSFDNVIASGTHDNTFGMSFKNSFDGGTYCNTIQSDFENNVIATAQYNNIGGRMKSNIIKALINNMIGPSFCVNYIDTLVHSIVGPDVCNCDANAINKSQIQGGAKGGIINERCDFNIDSNDF